MAPFTPLFIDGREVPASDNATFEVYNTSVSTIVGTSASASSADCDAAVQAEGRAFKSWEKTTPYARRDILLKAAELVETDHWLELTQRVAKEETACSAVWAHSPLRAWGHSYAPFGVAPWNGPFGLTVNAIAVPIISSMRRAFERGAELHLNVLRDRPGLDGPDYRAPSRQKDKRSERVGRIIATEAAKHLKPTVLELGGKTAAVVLNDASIPDAAKSSLIKSLSAELPFGKDSESAKLGHGPVFTEGSADNVVAMILEAQAAGAEVLLDDLGCGKVTSKQRGEVWDATMGEIIAIAVVDTPEEAVELTNSPTRPAIA
ncbi:Aldehyde/histidinol dehydrogenase [Mycena rebaudengoi]|nr:Aldehyde/histidinol dehydrogenase [Mycena rebaudengoi]